MKRSPLLALLMGPPLLHGAAAYAASEPPTPPAATAPAAVSVTPTAPAAPAAAAAPAAPPVSLVAAQAAPADVDTLRGEIERLRKESEEQRRQQEERIRALEQKLQELQKPAATPEKPAAPAPNPVTTRPGFKAKIYGFLRADLDIDSGKMFSHPHLPFWALSSQDPRAQNKSDGDFTIHPRLSRVGIDTEAPPLSRLGDAKLTGKLEIDFFNFVPGTTASTSNSRQFLRIRHAYGELAGKNYRFLFGQTWDLISPLFPSANADVLMWNAGNLGDRRPQLRATYEPTVGRGKALVSAAILSSDAVGGSNRDGDSTLDGEESKRPMVQGRVALNQPSWVKGQSWELGFWGVNAAYRYDRSTAIASGLRNRSFNSNGAGLDLRLPLTKRLLLQGEAWFGEALADVRGGVGQDINALGKEVRSHGGWGELLYQFSEVYTLGAGFTVDDPRNSDVNPRVGPLSGVTAVSAAGIGRTMNRTYYVVNRFNVGSGFVVGVDWMLFDTSFRGLSRASNNRWNIFLQHNF